MELTSTATKPVPQRVAWLRLSAAIRRAGVRSQANGDWGPAGNLLVRRLEEERWRRVEDLLSVWTLTL